MLILCSYKYCSSVFVQKEIEKETEILEHGSWVLGTYWTHSETWRNYLLLACPWLTCCWCLDGVSLMRPGYTVYSLDSLINWVCAVTWAQLRTNSESLNDDHWAEGMVASGANSQAPSPDQDRDIISRWSSGGGRKLSQFSTQREWLNLCGATQQWLLWLLLLLLWLLNNCSFPLSVSDSL